MRHIIKTPAGSVTIWPGSGKNAGVICVDIEFGDNVVKLGFDAPQASLLSQAFEIAAMECAGAVDPGASAAKVIVTREGRLQ